MFVVEIIGALLIGGVVGWFAKEHQASIVKDAEAVETEVVQTFQADIKNF